LRRELSRWQDAAMTTTAVDCLILVDLQAAFVTGPDAVPDAAVLLTAATDLLDRARQARSLIVHLQNDGAPGTEDEPGTPGWALYVEPVHGETVIRKATDDGFEGTDLGDILAASRVRRLAIAGVMSEMCVSATARSAFHRGLAVVLPHDAHATCDIAALPGIAPTIPAAMVARVAEWALGDQLELPATSQAVLFTAAP
jgi:nicotinamidase-related amidase